MIHPTAIIHPSAKIHETAEIGPYSVIGEATEIQAGVKVGSHCVIEHAVIGAHCIIWPGAYLGGAPQDFKYADEPTRLIVEENCRIRECVTLNRGTFKDGGTGVTRIGKNCYFMAYSHAGHDCIVGEGVIVTNNVALGGHVEVGDFAVLGGMAAVHQFTRIGKMAMIGGLSGVDRDVAPYCMAQGNRVGLIGINAVGLRRGGIARETVQRIKEAYKTLFLSGMRLEEAIKAIESHGPPPPDLAILLDFLKKPSKRGIARPRREERESERTIE